MKNQKTDFIPERIRLADLQKNFDKFEVPVYQRKYTWGLRNRIDSLEQFFNDIEALVFEENEEHFFNSLIFIKNKTTGIKEIIDGQQRLITSTMLLHGKALIYGGNFSLTSKQFLITNDTPEDDIEALDMYDFFTNTKKYGYEYSIGLGIDEMKIESDNFLKFFNKITDLYPVNNYIKNEYSKSLTDSTISHLKHRIINSYFKKDKKSTNDIVFEDNFNQINELEHSKRTILLLINAILYFLLEKHQNFSSINSTVLVHPLIKKLGYSAIHNLDYDNQKYKPIKALLENQSITYQNISDNIINWVSLSSEIIDYYLQFFIKINVKVSLNKRSSKFHVKAKKPYTNNFQYALEVLAEYYHKLVSGIISEKILIDKNTLAKNNNSLMKYLTSKIDRAFELANFISIEVSNPDPKAAIDVALSAFSSINSAGEPLEAFDIIRSNLFRDNKEELSELDDLVKYNEDFFKSLKKDEVLKFFFAAKNNVYRKEKLYRQFRNYIQQGNSYSDFVKDLIEFCEIIHYTKYGLTPNKDINKIEYSPALHLLGKIAGKNNTLYPVIYKIIKSDYLNNQKEEILLSFYYRVLLWLIINGSKSLINNLEKLLEELDNTGNTYDKIIMVIDQKFKINQIVETLELRMLNSENNFYNELGRHICILHEGHRRITCKKLDFTNRKVTFNLIEDSTIEHIVPRSSPRGQELKKMLGNLTLLSNRLNSSAGNKEYSEKIAYHLVSGLTRNIEIIWHHLENYNNKNSDRYVTISDVNHVQTNDNQDKPKYRTEIVNSRNENIASLFTNDELDLKWLIGISIDNEDASIGEWANDIIKCLSNQENVNSSIEKLKEDNCNCNTKNDFEPLMIKKSYLFHDKL